MKFDVITAFNVFAHVDENAEGGVKIDQKNFVFSMRLLGVMDVGKAGEGLPAGSQ
jgi:3-hydroxyacyl-[acyl-carrier-protein] dehydratase